MPSYIFYLSVLVLMIFQPVFVLAETSLPETLQSFYQQAFDAVKKGDESKADFYLARYMGITAVTPDSTKQIGDLYPIFNIYKVSKPTAVLSSHYSPKFVSWFVLASYSLWGFDEGAGDFTEPVKIASGNNGSFFAEVSAFPYLEGWSRVKEDKATILTLALADSKRGIYLSSGQILNGTIGEKFDPLLLDTEGLNLQYVWTPEFYDLDGDGIPEIWLRYNKAMATGFTQELAIYKIQGSKLILLKKFSGEAEGVARRIEGNRVEVGYGFTDNDHLGHLGFDRHHLEVWEYKKGTFAKVSEKEVPHLLWSDAWEAYF